MKIMAWAPVSVHRPEGADWQVFPRHQVERVYGGLL